MAGKGYCVIIVNNIHNDSFLFHVHVIFELRFAMASESISEATVTLEQDKDNISRLSILVKFRAPKQSELSRKHKVKHKATCAALLQSDIFACSKLV